MVTARAPSHIPPWKPYTQSRSHSSKLLLTGHNTNTDAFIRNTQQQKQLTGSYIKYLLSYVCEQVDAFASCRAASVFMQCGLSQRLFTLFQGMEKVSSERCRVNDTREKLALKVQKRYSSMNYGLGEILRLKFGIKERRKC